MKKLHVLAAFLIESHVASLQMSKQTGLKESGVRPHYIYHIRTCTYVQVRMLSRVLLTLQVYVLIIQVPTAVQGLMLSDGLTSSDALLVDRAWRGAEAFHFYMLAQNQLYQGQAEAALNTVSPIHISISTHFQSGLSVTLSPCRHCCLRNTRTLYLQQQSPL